MAMQLGVLLGPLTAGMINDNVGWNWMTVFMGIMAGTTAIVMLRVGKGWKVSPEQSTEVGDEAGGQAVEMQGLMRGMRESGWNEDVVERLGASHVKSAFP